jgi:hypothetical protein
VVHLERLYKRFKGRAVFAFVGVKEAGHVVPGFEHLLKDQGATGDGEWYKGRRDRVCRAHQQAGLSLPGFLDLPDHSASHTYSAWPGRLVVVGIDGRILRDFGSVAWKGWHWDEIARVLEAECARAPTRPPVAPASPL